MHIYTYIHTHTHRGEDFAPDYQEFTQEDNFLKACFEPGSLFCNLTTTFDVGGKNNTINGANPAVNFPVFLKLLLLDRLEKYI
jgi:hypothetical protein